MTTAPGCAAQYPYSYNGGAACSSCVSGATRLSYSRGCAPAVWGSRPTETLFYLSGASSEGVAAFSLTGASPTYEADRFNAASSALVLASGSYLNVAPGSTLPSAWVSSTSGYSASAWVKCAAPNNVNGLSAVLELGSPGDVLGAASTSALALVVGGMAPRANSGVVTTSAGSGSAAFSDGTGANAAFSSPSGIVVGASGTAYIADSSNNRIRAMTPAGVVTTLAGGGSSSGTSAGFADGTGTSALFSGPSGLAILSSGLIIVADTGNRRIRQVTSAGVVTTLCGSGVGTPVDGTGTSAIFSSFLRNIAVIPGSNVLVVSDGNQIKLVTAGNSEANTGVVTTFAGGAGSGTINGEGTNARFTGPNGIAVVPVGADTYYLVVCDTGNSLLRKVTYPGGVVTTLAGGADPGYADGTGTNALFENINSVALLPARGTSSPVVVVTDAGGSSGNYIRIVTAGGVVTTLAGSTSNSYADGTGANAALSSPLGIAVNPTTGDLLFADSGSNRIRRVMLPAILPACDSAWHHVALTYSESGSASITGYVDGALVFVQSGTITLPNRNSASLRIGWSGDLNTNGGSLFAGSMSDLRIYEYPLTAAQVAFFLATT
jgi:sugar lactone lactonase YvrE